MRLRFHFSEMSSVKMLRFAQIISGVFMYVYVHMPVFQMFIYHIPIIGPNIYRRHLSISSISCQTQGYMLQGINLYISSICP